MGVEPVEEDDTDANHCCSYEGAMLSRIGEVGRRWAVGANPWTNVYGMARTVLALGTLSTLLFTHTDALFISPPGIPSAPLCLGPARVSLFCNVPDGQLEVGRWVAVAILLVVVSGWRPRVTGVLHWWVAYSLNVTATMVDGGDQVTSVLTLLLLPLSLTDSRRWHWQAASQHMPERREELARIVALSAALMIRLQVAGIYFHAAVGKFKSEEWADGTAVYYWFTHPTHGMGAWLSGILTPVLTNPYGVVVFTWGTLVLELLLFMGLVVEKKHRRKLLWLGIFFHAGIAVVHGLLSFVLAMWAALILFLRPLDEEVRVPSWAHVVAARLARLRAVLGTTPPSQQHEPAPPLPIAEAGPVVAERTDVRH